MTHDMTKGSPIKLILAFSLPLFLGNIFQQLYSMADTIIVGRTISVQALAAVGATGAFGFMVIGFVQGFTGGFAVITAQRFGANDYDGIRRSVATSTILSIIITIIITIISVTATRPLLILMNTPPDILEDAYTYTLIIFIGIGATVFYNLLSNIIRSLGDSKTPLMFLVVSSVINIVLDLVFILCFHMGVAGAAWATIIAQFVSGILCLIYAFKKIPLLHFSKSDWKINFSFAWEHLRIGLPMAFQFAITAIGVMVVQSALNSFGSTTVAGFTAACKIDQIVQQPMLAFGATMSTFIAQNYGAGKIERIKEGMRKCSILSVCISALGGLCSVLFGKHLIQLFVGTHQPQVVKDAQTYLITVSFFYVVLALLFIYRNALQGIGKTTVPLLSGFCEVIMRILVAGFFAKPFGYIGICLTEPIAWIGGMVPLAIAYFYHIKKLSHSSLFNLIK